jgi:RNA polymerase sigma-70 factor (ECF subfamily)
MAIPSDTALVARARRGDGGAVEALARRHLRPAYAAALAVVGNVADAEDIAQESLMVSLQRLDQCREPARFASWLLQGVRNRALNRLNQARVRAGHAERVVRDEPSVADATDVLLRQRLLGALEQLGVAQREVVLLHDLEGWTHGEIAGALDISEVMSRQHLFVARRVMRNHLAKEPREEPPNG